MSRLDESPVTAKAFPIALQRNSFSPRLSARAGDVWRAMQDVVVDQSADVGWDPERYERSGTMFVVRSMTVQHLRELRFEDRLVGRTWPVRARRDMLFTREVRLFAAAELVAAASQEWAYLSRALAPTRAGSDLYGAFTREQGFPSVDLPEFASLPVTAPRRFEFDTWHVWMDPFGHINHPAYVDFCDEATSRVLARAGRPALQLSPVAESVHFRAAIGAEERVTVEVQLLGTVGADAVMLGHRLLVNDQVCATAKAVRRLLGHGHDVWCATFG
jgi:acyl-CoA thioesterase FadM